MKKIILILTTVLILSCNNTTQNKDKVDSIPMTKINAANDNEWVSLIQQNSMDGWHYYQDNGKKTGWDIKDGVLTFTSANASGEGDKSLVSDKEYTNFKIHL